MIKKFLNLLLLVCFMSVCALPAEAADFGSKVSGMTKLNNVRVFSDGDKKVRIVLDTSKEASYKKFVLSNPTRIAVDIENAWVGDNVAKETPVAGGMVGKVRVSQFNATTVRVVIEANVGKDKYRVFALGENKAAGKSPRIVLDFGEMADDAASVPTESGTMQSKETLPDASEAVPKEITLFEVPGISGKKIAIDAGHGGSDAGATGPSGVTEKSVTFRIAQKLETLLKSAGATVIMTRSSDVDVAYADASAAEELQARCDIANNANADIFVSIHMDAFVNQQASGTTGYYYPKTNGDERLAKFVKNGVIAKLGTDDRTTRTCNFYVVKNTKMPATLVEVAFISNAKEESLLKSDAGAQKAAQGIYDGIEKYFSDAK
jgi:N-acetylmuramoyl-L-alanine amidase